MMETLTAVGKALQERSYYHDNGTKHDAPASTEAIVDQGNKRKSTYGAEGIAGGDDALEAACWCMEI